MFTIQSKIAEILKPYDSKKMMAREDLLKRLHDLGEVIEDREMRNTVSKMITEGHHAIGSTHSGGYFTIKTSDDLAVAETEMVQKIESMAVRRWCLRRNFQEARQFDKHGQGDLL